MGVCVNDGQVFYSLSQSFFRVEHGFNEVVCEGVGSCVMYPWDARVRHLTAAPGFNHSWKCSVGGGWIELYRVCLYIESLNASCILSPFSPVH